MKSSSLQITSPSHMLPLLTHCSLLLFLIKHNIDKSLAQEDQLITYDQLFQFGKDAYTVENWHECVAYMRRALNDYHFYRDGQFWCRKNCLLVQLPEVTENDSPQMEIAIFHRFSERALCLLRCKLDQYGSRRPQKRPDEKIEREFELRRPYHYLQFCHWKLKDLSNAVKSAYTFLIGNPGDRTTSDNLKYYSTLANYSPDFLVDLEQKMYQKFYLEAVKFYNEKEWIESIDRFERALDNYWEQEEGCRLQCQSSVDLDVFDGPPEFIVTITSQQAALLRCRLNCPASIGIINGNVITNFLPSHFDYIQFAYYKVDRGRKACESVGNYLLLLANDERMLANKRYYMQTLNVGEDLFIPNKKVLEYYRRAVLEKRALDFIDEKFRYFDNLLSPETVDDRKPFVTDIPEIDSFISWEENNGHKSTENVNMIAKNVQEQKEQKQSSQWTPDVNRLKDFAQKNAKNFRLITDRELSGNFRFLVDNFLTPEECNTLIGLQTLVEKQNGLDLKNDRFHGLSLNQIIELILSGKVQFETGKLLLDRSETARHFIGIYFNLTTNLLFDSMHFVCKMSPENNDDDDYSGPDSIQSNPYHNMLLSESKNRKKKLLNVFRGDFIIIIFLNGRDETFGSFSDNFAFFDRHRRIQASIEPVCGRMIGFTADTHYGFVSRNEHIRRCEIVMRLTNFKDQKNEADRSEAQQRLARFEMDNFA